MYNAVSYISTKLLSEMLYKTKYALTSL